MKSLDVDERPRLHPNQQSSDAMHVHESWGPLPHVGLHPRRQEPIRKSESESESEVPHCAKPGTLLICSGRASSAFLACHSS